ncbi:MAG TPA: helix-turn-helix transcriptional regulator [Solirubrobacteraceae bacterium]|nr:helix-turn-helix transcriptional regulator [Solirubrobacteraceae bacterium]
MSAPASTPTPPSGPVAAGDADLAALGAVLGEPARARVLLALADGRALPASVLAAEAGVAASTASEHLARLLESGLVRVEPQGRHRYYRLAGPSVGELIEVLARHAPAAPVRSLRQGTRAQQLRAARTCYDHLAGRLGVALFAALLDCGAIAGGDGRHDPARAREDRLSAPGHDVDYRLTERGRGRLGELGVRVPDGDALRYCVDWTEQRHHLSGAHGRALAERLFELGWIRRARTHRALQVSEAGRRGLAERLGVSLDAPS